MTPDEWRRVKAIVSEAWDQPPAAREGFVATACGADEAIRREVCSLLESIEQVGDRFETPAIELAGAGEALHAILHGDLPGSDLSPSMIGRRLGAYEIRRELGRGGMGAVYLASRVDDEFTHDVALKIIKRGMDTEAIVRRFRTERQILAGLNHPHIARLLDGGTTADGLPYLVMEYVDGQPITDYCDARALAVGERLQLFQQICGAVAHAHQHLIVHRDIKPSNVMVTLDGRPKLLDFGLATILDPSSGDRDVTRTASRWMTPDFASPEQVRGGPVTTASDIYSLGVLLYELLCGHRPFTRGRTDEADWPRTTDEQTAEKPSAALFRNARPSTDSDAGGSRLPPEVIGAARRTKPERLRRLLRGDLDNIVLKALHSDPARRYAGAQDLAEDVRRHLARLPVSARRDTFLYHGTRFVRRHTTAAVAAMLAVVTLVAATIVTTAQARIARREREHAERRFKDVRRLANSFLFDFHDAIATLPGATPAREMVVKTAQEYLDSLAQEAGADRELWMELSTAYLKLGDVLGRPSASRIGDTDGALRNYEKALALRRRLAAPRGAVNAEFEHGVAIVLVRMGPIFQVRGEPASAVQRTREAMQIMDRLAATAPSAEVRRNAFRAPFYLGDALSDTGDYDGALAMYTKALAVAETARLDPPESDFRHRLAVISERLGIMLMVKGEPQRALERFRDALANEEAMRAAEPDNAGYAQMTANAHYYIAGALRERQNYRDALVAARRALGMYEELARADPRDASAKKNLGGSTHQIAETLLAAGDHQAARRLLQRTIAIRRELAQQDTGSIEYRDDLADSLGLWGESLLAGGETAAAMAAFDEARAIREPIVASRPQQVVYTRGLARLYTNLGDAHMQAARGVRQPADEWRDARRWYQHGRDLWTDLEKRHALWAGEMTQPAAAGRSLARCERLLAHVPTVEDVRPSR